MPGFDVVQLVEEIEAEYGFENETDRPKAEFRPK